MMSETQTRLEYVLEQLQRESKRRRLPIVAEGSGVSLSTIGKILRREVTRPSIHHVEALFSHFERAAKRREEDERAVAKFRANQRASRA
jgi:hypothetical protein